MPRIVIGQNQLADLHPADVIGSGGEGTVFRVKTGRKPPVAVKLYHDPTQKKATKLRDFLNLSLPAEVIGPLELVFDEHHRQTIGFSMRLLPPGQQALETLSGRKHREVNRISTKDVVGLYLRLYGVLDQLHKNKVIVGDLNSLNGLYLLPEIALIDADSFQFGRYPCEVATDRFLNPRLFGVDLSARPVFEPNDDWYSYLVLLFSGLLLVHPYGGSHRTLRTIPKRALERITVFDSSVTYPVTAYSPEVASDDLLAFFEKAFTKGQVEQPKLQLLESYQSILVGCQACGIWYPSSRKKCPGCQATNKLIQRIKIQIQGVQTTELLETQGPIVFFKLIGTTLYVVASEKGQAVLYIKKQLNKSKKVVLFQVVTGARYEAFGKYLAVCPQPFADEPQIYIFDTSTGSAKLVTKTVTDRFGDRGAVYRGSGKYLYRVVGGILLAGEIPFGYDLVERTVATVMENQTWFDADPSPDRELLFGFYRVFEKHEWFLLRNGIQHLVKIPALEKGESMIDRSIRFSGSTILLLRKTRQARKDFCRIEMVDIESGEIVSSRRVLLTDNPQLSNLHGVAYARGTILIPQDTGLLAENAQSGGQKTYPQTANFVADGDQLWPYEGGILNVSDRRVLQISLR